MHVFLLDTATVSDEKLKMLEATLPPERLARARRCRTAVGYAQAVLGFCLVKYAVTRVTGRVFAGDWVLSESGKPQLKEGAPHFNLSHTAHCIAVAVSDMPVGIDVEEIRPHAPKLAQKFFSDEERRMIEAADDPISETVRIWSAKEAVAKEKGTGIASDFRNIPANGVKNTRFSAGGIPHWLSLSPTAEMPPLTWINGAEL